MTALQDLKAADERLGQSVTGAIAKLAQDANDLAIAHQNGASDEDLATMTADLAAKAAALDAAVNPGQGSPQATSTGSTAGAAGATGPSNT